MSGEMEKGEKEKDSQSARRDEESKQTVGVSPVLLIHYCRRLGECFVQDLISWSRMDATGYPQNLASSPLRQLNDSHGTLSLF